MGTTNGFQQTMLNLWPVCFMVRMLKVQGKFSKLCFWKSSIFLKISSFQNMKFFETGFSLFSLYFNKSFQRLNLILCSKKLFFGLGQLKLFLKLFCIFCLSFRILFIIDSHLKFNLVYWDPFLVQNCYFKNVISKDILVKFCITILQVAQLLS